jgi:hypothetical protein
VGTTLTAALLALAAAVPGDPAPGKGKPDPLAAKVKEAIAKGVAWVRKQQREDGHFHGNNGVPLEKDPDADLARIFAGHRVGETALALHALRSCGVPADDPQVAAGFAFVRAGYARQRKVDGLQCYDISFILIALDTHRQRAAPDAARKPARGAPPPVDDGPWIREMTAWLVAAQGKTGGFGYSSPGYYDNDLSNTQVALLALHAARRSGAEVPAEVFRRALAYFLDAQESSGPAAARRDETWKPDAKGEPRTEGARDRARGWGYKPRTEGTGSMTAGGVSSLAICRAELSGSPGYDGKLDARAEQGIWDGLAWLGARFTVTENPGPRGAPAAVAGKQYYWLYAMERAGALSGIPWAGEHDWYREGARWLVDNQQPSGAWPSVGLTEACFALLFLQRATPPAPRGAVSGSSSEGAKSPEERK